jgi:tRNA(Ile)-lysidine synthase
MGKYRVHSPLPAERKSGTPEGVEIPAPVSATTFFAALISSAARRMSWYCFSLPVIILNDAIISDTMLDRVHSILQQIPNLELQRIVLLGVSGGPDSLVLLDLLSQLEYPVAVAHFDHGWRQESAEEARYVREMVVSRGLPFFLGKEDVKTFASKNSLSLEEAARVMRYRFLFSTAKDLQAQAVAVAHTADDQVETILMHLLRGTGLSGLTGMDYNSLPNEWSQDILLIRPLLHVWREEVVQYCKEHNLKPLIDPSNQDTTFFRNRLRIELMPYLESYNPSVRRSLWKTALVLKGDDELIQKQVGAEWPRILQETGPGYAGLHNVFLQELPLGLQRRLLRKAIALLRPGLRDIGFDMVERGLLRLEGKKTGLLTDLGENIYLYVEGETAWIADWEAELPTSRWPQLQISKSGTCEEIRLSLPGEAALRHGWELQARKDVEVGSALFEASRNQDPYQAWLDASRLHFPLIIRCRKPGDRFQPLGMENGSLKLSDLMINEKIPKRVRRAWPMVISGEEIAWIPGIRTAHAFRLSEDTNQILHLKLFSPEEKKMRRKE